MTDGSAIIATKLHVAKDGVEILRELDFKVSSGSITGLIGPSGSGKTTLMRTIVGVQRITTGSLVVLGERAGAKDLRDRIGYMAQTPAIYSDLTVLQNVKYFAKVLGLNRQQALASILAVDLVEYQNQLVEKLSGGQKVRVSLAIALLGDPDILVLDEPTVGLDPVLRRDLWALFKALASRGKMLIISSHVMDEAEHCDNILLLRDGTLLWSEDKNALLKQAAAQSVEAAFLTMINKAKGN